MPQNTNSNQADSQVNRPVFFTSASLIVVFSLVTIFFNQTINNLIVRTVNWVANTFNWYYLMAASIYLIFVISIALSRFGRIKLGPNQSQPEYSLFSWMAMLFSAGIGIDLLFFSIAEPLSHYMQPPVGQAQTIQAAREGVLWTLFHYGATGWGMYALIGLALGYFSFRYNLPLTIRTTLYPVFGRRINGYIGHTVDVLAVLGAIFGIATTCGIGVLQLNYGLNVLFGAPINLLAQVGLIIFAVIMAIISATTGISKGVRIFSIINIFVSLGLILYILFMGNTGFLLKALVQNIGDYISKLPALSLESFAFEDANEWLRDWTLFFWAWWVAWAPFVGLFLAKISRGRTIREFVCATLIIPFLFTLLWLSVFGNSALYSVIFDGNTALLDAVRSDPAEGFYLLLKQYDGYIWLASIATISGLLFYVTSADSGAIVLGYFTSKLKTTHTEVPRTLTIFWSVAIALLTIAMLMANGITALQNATVIMGLPFSFIMLLIIVGLIRSFRVEDTFNASKNASIISNTNAINWRLRISRVMNYPDSQEVLEILANVSVPALKEVSLELAKQDIQSAVSTSPIVGETDLYHANLVVDFGDEQSFVYQIWPQKYRLPNFNLNSNIARKYYYRLETFLAEGTQNNDLTQLTKEELINDILDKYEQHLEFLRIIRQKKLRHKEA